MIRRQNLRLLWLRVCAPARLLAKRTPTVMTAKALCSHRIMTVANIIRLAAVAAVNHICNHKPDFTKNNH